MADLPPLAAVRVFEATARLGNLSRAAAELNMTQSAVSYHIRQVEAFAGAPLFVRLARGVELTPRGRLIAPVVSRSLAELRQAFRLLREESDNLLVISTMQTIASSWLAPRIGKLQLLHPELAVRLDVSARLVDFASESVDVAIRSGRGEWPGLSSHFLIAQTFTPVASPDYLSREGRPATPSALLAHVLIAPSDTWWQVWFDAAGVAGPLRIARPGIDVETQQMATRVALAGHGVTLVTPGFVQDDLTAGRLVQLFDMVTTAGLNYYIVYPEAVAQRRKIRLFRDWALAEAGQSEMR
jgi:LysR family glycine cleavage system transcriptional activator